MRKLPVVSSKSQSKENAYCKILINTFFPEQQITKQTQVMTRIIKNELREQQVQDIRI